MHESLRAAPGVRAYLELHIEQGPVLERRRAGRTVLGTFGVERHVAVFTGQAAHAGTTPMGLRGTLRRRAQAALAIREIANETTASAPWAA